MKASNIVFALCFGSMMVVATGCGKSKALVAAEEYEKSACACKDTACVTEATKKYGEHAKEAGAVSSGDAEAFTKATAAASECMTKITMASIPAMPGMPKK